MGKMKARNECLFGLYKKINPESKMTYEEFIKNDNRRERYNVEGMLMRRLKLFAWNAEAERHLPNKSVPNKNLYDKNTKIEKEIEDLFTKRDKWMKERENKKSDTPKDEIDDEIGRIERGIAERVKKLKPKYWLEEKRFEYITEEEERLFELLLDIDAKMLKRYAWEEIDQTGEIDGKKKSQCLKELFNELVYNGDNDIWQFLFRNIATGETLDFEFQLDYPYLYKIAYIYDLESRGVLPQELVKRKKKLEVQIQRLYSKTRRSGRKIDELIEEHNNWDEKSVEEVIKRHLEEAQKEQEKMN